MGRRYAEARGTDGWERLKSVGCAHGQRPAPLARLDNLTARTHASSRARILDLLLSPLAHARSPREIPRRTAELPLTAWGDSRTISPSHDPPDFRREKPTRTHTPTAAHAVKDDSHAVP